LSPRAKADEIRGSVRTDLHGVRSAPASAVAFIVNEFGSTVPLLCPMARWVCHDGAAISQIAAARREKGRKHLAYRSNVVLISATLSTRRPPSAGLKLMCARYISSMGEFQIPMTTPSDARLVAAQPYGPQVVTERRSGGCRSGQNGVPRNCPRTELARRQRHVSRRAAVAVTGPGFPSRSRRNE
jgi:hypothetical protein